jgi:hypothetical protein
MQCRITIFFCLWLLVTGCSVHKKIAGEKWLYIGQTDVTSGESTANIPTRGFDVYENIKLYVLRSTLTITDIEFLYEDDSSAVVSVQTTVTPANYSRAFRVPAQAKRLKKVTVYYRFTQPQQRVAILKCYGLRKEN